VQKKAKLTKEMKYFPYKERENMLIEWFQQKHKRSNTGRCHNFEREALKTVIQLHINHFVASNE
jgi:hypothetical protein